MNDILCMEMQKYKYLKIGNQNIQGGAYNKLSHPDLVKIVHNHDIFCIQEACLENDSEGSETPEISGYKCYKNLRNKGKKKRVFGGNLIYYRAEYENKYIKKLGSKYQDFLWIWVDGKYFHLPTDLYICSVYIPHENSIIHTERTNDPFKILAEETAVYEKQGMIYYAGDFNSRTGEIMEEWELNDPILKLPSGDNIDNKDNYNISDRINTDRTVNNFGKKLIKLCNNLGLVILNGRKTGDSAGRLTFHGSMGNSTIDYAICSLSMYEYIQTVTINEPCWYSDHCLMTTVFNRSHVIEWTSNRSTDDNIIENSRSKYVWDEESQSNFCTMMTDETTLANINQINELLNDMDTNTMCQKITDILKNVADKTCKIKTSSMNSPKKVSDNKNIIPPQFREKLKWAKHNFHKAKEKYKDRTNDSNRRHTMIKARKTYKNLIYLIERYKKEDKIKKIASLEKKDPQQFWAGLKKLNKKKTNTSVINPKNWLEYFKDLLNINNKNIDQQFLDYTKSSLPIIKQNAIPNEQLNNPIDMEELIKNIKSLKSKKAAGPDMINNGMIKSAGTYFHRLLLNIYNKILSTGIYPNIWKSSIITKIFKSGDVNIPSNYRGIALSNALHKLFTKIINKRILKFMKDNNKWAINQNAFLENRRTEDNILILHSVFHKYVKKEKKKLYVAFIDFRKFFDTINRDHLMYKLIKEGICGKIHDVIQSMYQGTQYCIETDEGLTKYFQSNSGVLQGCNLSPTLSNIYQNDLHNIFKDNTDPIELTHNSKFNSISWADDLILLSLSSEGLQKCLNDLQAYCKKWGLSINIDKTKIMIMSSSKQNPNLFKLYIQNEILEVVDSYKYLGIIINYNGNHKKAIEDRTIKATRCGYAIKNAIGNSGNISVKLALTLFHKQISPILLYGCSIWSPPKLNYDIDVFTNLDWFATRQIRDIINNLTDQNIDIENTNINRSRNMVTVKLKSWEDKLKILQCYARKPGTFIITDKAGNEMLNYRNDIDKVQTKFLKFTLGVSKYTNNSAIYTELKQSPISLKAYRLAMLYHYRLENEIDDNFLLKEAYSSMKENKHPWLDSISWLYAKSGMTNIFKNINYFRKSLVSHTISRKFTDIFIQENKAKLGDKEHFRDLISVIEHPVEKNNSYIDKIKTPSAQKVFSKLRLNNTKLSTGPYKSIIKTCLVCNTENSIRHTLLGCQTTANTRKKYFDIIENMCPQFKTLPNQNQFIRILNLDFTRIGVKKEVDIISATISFVCNIYRELSERAD